MNTAALERDLKTKSDAALALYKKHAETAETESRATTKEERDAVDGLVAEANVLREKLAAATGDSEQLKAIKKLTEGMGLKPATDGALPLASRRMSMGQQFVRAAEYDFFRKGNHRVQSAWRSPSVELFSHTSGLDMHATTITEDPASGGALILPQYLPGILPLLFKPLRIADLFAPGTTTSNAIAYMREKTFTNAAAPTLEGATKPESALIFDAVTDPVRKIAHFLPVTEELLEDEPAIASYIDARLRLGVELIEDDQLLHGTGVAPQLTGLANVVGLAPALGPPVAPAQAADIILQQIMAIAATSFLMPDAIAMNPSDWTSIALLKTTQGAYLGGGPFNPSPTPVLWGLPVSLTPTVTAGAAWVGAFKQGGQIFRRGGMRVEASNSHVDFFIKNLVAIRAEERLVLAVYRPQAFGQAKFV
jgi:HK97 family phage major capsid protein